MVSVRQQDDCMSEVKGRVKAEHHSLGRKGIKIKEEKEERTEVEEGGKREA